MTTWVPTTTDPEAAGLPPGLYERLPTAPTRLDVRLDVAAFVGLTERGPIGEPVGVGSMTGFAERFGRRGGGRQLPDAVHLFFANGGRRAVIVRAASAGAVAAQGRLEGVIDQGTIATARLEARDPGVWGDDLRLEWRWRLRPPSEQPTPVGGDPSQLEVDPTGAPAVGTLLRCTITPAVTVPPDPIVEVLRFVVAHVPRADGSVRLVLDAPDVAEPPGSVRTRWEEVRAQLVVRWAERTEVFEDVALHPAHPAWLGAALADSRLVTLASTSGGPFVPELGSVVEGRAVWVLESSGDDDPSNTSREVFFSPLDASPLDALVGWDDVAETEPVAMVGLPDLVHLRATLTADVLEPDGGDTRFGSCVLPEAEVTPPAELEWPLLAADHQADQIGVYQRRLVEHCGPRRRLALLDLPPGLDAGGILRWRALVADDRAAGYAPWLRIEADDALRTAPPCGAVAGVVARSEARRGVHVAPANVVLAGVFGLVDEPLLPDAGFLHEERIDAIRAAVGGLTVLGARTLSYDPDWTHLNVRRTIDWLARQIAVDARWATFEPNNRRLWRRLVRMVEARLQQLGAAGAWAGSTPATSWFVRCDETTTTPADLDAGRVNVQVGVAVARPAEFVVFELALVVESRDG